MSKHNKVNKDHYTQRGRLTPDEAAREQAKQRQAASAAPSPRPPSPPKEPAASARQAEDDETSSDKRAE